MVNRRRRLIGSFISAPPRARMVLKGIDSLTRHQAENWTRTSGNDTDEADSTKLTRRLAQEQVPFHLPDRSP